MTNKQKGALGFLIISSLAAFWFVNSFVPETTAENAVETKPRPSIFTEIKETQSTAGAAVTESAKLAMPITQSDNEWRAQLQKCFSNADVKDMAKENIVSFFEKRTNLSAPTIELEHYELKTADNQDLVVQYIPNEELRNQVRVFSISKQDGLPDRISEFPDDSAEVSKRLSGALSLGTLIQKKETTQQSGDDQETLEIEKTKDTILRVRYSEPGLEFSCDEKKCNCLEINAQ